MCRRKYISVTWMDRCAVIFFAISVVITLLTSDVITGLPGGFLIGILHILQDSY